MVAWFESHPHLTLTTKPQEWENPSGSVTGMQFYVEVNADTPENELATSTEGPSVATFPIAPRNASFFLAKGKVNRVIVIEREDAWMAIITEGPPDEFDRFKDRVDEEVLANLHWGRPPDEQP